MKLWTVRELEAIERDIKLASEVVRSDFAQTLNNPSSLLDSAYDCVWLAERIAIREQHGVQLISRCDGCPDESGVPVVVIVDEYADDMGAPSTLGLSHVCRYHLNQF